MSGVCSAGLAMTALPAASAAATWPRKIASGKFHGEMQTKTPRPRWRGRRVRRSGPGIDSSGEQRAAPRRRSSGRSRPPRGPRRRRRSSVLPPSRASSATRRVALALRAGRRAVRGRRRASSTGVATSREAASPRAMTRRSTRPASRRRCRPRSAVDRADDRARRVRRLRCRQRAVRRDGSAGACAMPATSASSSARSAELHARRIPPRGA